jgi:hypothetical protein
VRLFGSLDLMGLEYSQSNNDTAYFSMEEETVEQNITETTRRSLYAIANYDLTFLSKVTECNPWGEESTYTQEQADIVMDRLNTLHEGQKAYFSIDRYNSDLGQDVLDMMEQGLTLSAYQSGKWKEVSIEQYKNGEVIGTTPLQAQWEDNL